MDQQSIKKCMKSFVCYYVFHVRFLVETNEVISFNPDRNFKSISIEKEFFAFIMLWY